MRKMAVLRMPAAGALMTLIALAGAAGSLGACNTAAGFGQIQIDTSHRAVSFVARAPAAAR